MPQGTNHKEPNTGYDSEVLVRVENVSKIFCRDLKKSLLYGLKDSARDLFTWGKKIEDGRSWIVDEEQDPRKALSDHPEFKIQNPKSAPHAQGNDDDLRSGEFYAVRDVSFELKRGECLGLIGRNGAGKTTLLKMLNGLIKPDAGRIEMRGRIGALIALGAGFNPILSGRENIYINGSILGLTKMEIDEKIDEIIDFAEIGEFIDAPVQSYSSGMQVRLGFAVATAMEPDVLILDEVLAVGDAAFRAKCYNRIVWLRKRAAVIFVTHSMEQIGRVCDSALLLSRGRVAASGDAAICIHMYEKLNEAGEDQDASFLKVHLPITGFKQKEFTENLQSGAALSVCWQLSTVAELLEFRLRISFYNPNGEIVAEVNETSRDHGLVIRCGVNLMRVSIPIVPLRAGTYSLGWGIIDSDGDLIVWSYKQYRIKVTGGSLTANTEVQLPVSNLTLIDQYP